VVGLPEKKATLRSSEGSDLTCGGAVPALFRGTCLVLFNKEKYGEVKATRRHGWGGGNRELVKGPPLKDGKTPSHAGTVGSARHESAAEVSKATVSETAEQVRGSHHNKNSQASCALTGTVLRKVDYAGPSDREKLARGPDTGSRDRA